MDVEYESMNCCGMRELVGVSEEFNRETNDGDHPLLDPKRAVGFVKRSAFPEKSWGVVDKPAHIVFSDIRNVASDGEVWDNYKGGRMLTRYIRANKLGVVRVTPAAKNKNSGHDVIAWIWTPDWKKIEKHEV